MEEEIKVGRAMGKTTLPSEEIKPLAEYGEHLNGKGEWVKCSCNLARYPKDRVREAVRLLKEECNLCYDFDRSINFKWLILKVDKIFGEGLI